MKDDLLIEKKFRPEIEGLRVIAALLVAIYHIWFGRVSGGVDVFFIVSGFLITTSLLSGYYQSNKIRLSFYYLNLMRRLFPLAFTVLFFTIIFCQFWLPQIRWDETLNEIIASIFYYENWQLAINSVDYLAQNNEASPVQHFWAMSLQGQFYIIWPLLITFIIFLRKKLYKNISMFKLIMIVFIFIFIISISYSVYKTSTNQPWAYFDTFARMWEFTLGGILSIVIAKLNFSRQLANLLGWIGLLLVISTGIVLPVSTVFPGYLALYPTLGAVLIILAGSNGGSYGINRLLTSKFLTNLGKYSYGIYLWHWPILIFYLIKTGKSNVPIIHGLIIIFLSLFLSYISTKFIETPVRKINFQKHKLKFVLTLLIFLVPTIISTTIWNNEVVKGINNLNNLILDENYPGAIALSSLYGKNIQDKNVDIIPNPMQSRRDLPDVYTDDCHHPDDKVIICEYGVLDNPEYVIALVGGSHSAQWLPTLQEISKTEDILIVNMTKSACRFSDRDNVQNLSQECYLWNENVITELIKLKPDLVFTIADWGSRQIIPDGFLKQWRKLEENGIQVFALRDNAWLNFDPAACVEEKYPNYDKCSVKQDDVLPRESAWDKLDVKPNNVYYYDLTDYFCTEGICHVVIGNVLVYRDSHHITATYARTLAPILKPVLMDKLYNK